MTDNSNSQLIPLVRGFKGLKVFCIGDIILDRFIAGDIERISPEAPIPVLKIQSEDLMLGGAGNVMRNLVALGAQVRFVSVIGNDNAGSTVLSMIKKDTDISENIIIENERQTSIKTRYLSGNQQILRTDKETISDIRPSSENTLFKIVERELSSTGGLVLSDYGKGVLTRDLLQKLIIIAQTKKIPVIVDPKGTDFSCYKGATLITPNRKELELATKLPTNNDKNITVAARKLMKSCKIGSVLVTRSSDGMTLEHGLKTNHFKAEAREVFDVSGAGDTVAAVMTCALSSKASLVDGAKIANIAAGIVVGKFGTASVSASEVIDYFDTNSQHEFKTKIITESDIPKLLQNWRRKGKKIGFTNGCFDILHPGHLSLLRQAKSTCDKLIVALNTDQSIQRIKGQDRPLMREKARAELVASLASVDTVLFFDEDTPLKLIKKIKPNILIKGADYSAKAVIGAQFVTENGGKVILAKITDGFSSSSIIDKMRQK